MAIDIVEHTAPHARTSVIKDQRGVGLRAADRFRLLEQIRERRSLMRSWNHGASEKKRERLVLSALSSTQRVILARLLLSRTIRPVR